MIPTYSQQAKSAIATVTQNAYSAFVYFEDKDEEHLYEELIKLITPLHSSIRVICLEGKASLIEHHASQTVKLRPKSLYVLDKDFDDKLCKMMSRKGITYLKKYSIENHLVVEDAINEIATEEKPKHKEPSFLHTILEENLTKLLNLTTSFLVAQRFNLGIPNCGESVHRFSIDQKPWILCTEKIQNYRYDIELLLALDGHASSEREIDQIFDGASKEVSKDDVPGKMLLDITKAYICHKLAIRGLSQDSFRYRLAKKASVDEFQYLAEVIERHFQLFKLHGH